MTQNLEKYIKIVERIRRLMNEKKSIIIFSAKKARDHLRKGYRIVDIKPDRSDEEGKRSVFVFENKEGILD